MAGIRTKDVDVAEVHDCFAIAELISYEEELGFSPKGAGPFVQAGRSDGDGVVNPRGGLIGCGHPLGATGVAQAVEIFQQLRGEAGARQAPEATIGLTHNNSGMGEHVVLSGLTYRCRGACWKACAQGAALGEITQALKDVFGEHKGPVKF